MSFVYYDTETTGTNTMFDQILQFAAIKTDDDLNVLDRFEIRCRLMPHIVPTPKALLVTGASPSMLLDKSLPSHYEAMRKIHLKLTEWSPAVFLGYNTIQFDEHLLRQAFFQTLHPLYLTNTNGNARADVMRMVQAMSVFEPNGIRIPKDKSGRSNMKLENLASVNGYNHDDAHEAMADVLATIHMARLVKDKAPDVWGSLLRTARKNQAQQIIISNEMFSFTDFFFGKSYSWLVTYCGQNPQNSSQYAVFDLSHSPEEYFDLSVEDLIEVLAQSPTVIRKVRVNTQPILMPADKHPEGSAASDISENELMGRAERIRANADFIVRVGHALEAGSSSREKSPYVEEQIYDGFPAAEDDELMGQFHGGSSEIISAIPDRFQDPRLHEFSKRLLYLEKPELLSSGDKDMLDGWVFDRVLSEDPDVPWNTVPKAKRDLAELLDGATGTENKFLRDIGGFLDGYGKP